MLFEYIKEKIGATYKLSNSSKEFLLRYNWEGNLRELQNCIEYLAYLEKDIIELDDLRNSLDDENHDIHESLDTLKHINCRTFTLKCLYDSMKELKGIGRRNILDKAKTSNVFITESELRKILNDLSNEGLVHIKKGRGGAYLTSKGLNVISEVLS